MKIAYDIYQGLERFNSDQYLHMVIYSLAENIELLEERVSELEKKLENTNRVEE